MRLHHVALGARDVETVARFYRLAFDLTERQRFAYENGSPRSIWLEADSVLLMIEHSAGPKKRVETIGTGPFLLAFDVSVRERSSVEARLRALGAPVEATTAFTAYARDPEGNRVAISHFPEPEA
jgi:catechol 2,3-dioxygenase-like lactoylglutathione lyase family enzyme